MTRPEASLFDRALLAIAPGLAARRMRSRRDYWAHSAAVQYGRQYEAAKGGRRNEGWVRPATSANAEVVSSFAGLTGGARQLVRDNGHAANAVNVIANNTIGTGIRAGFAADGDATERRLLELWETHAETASSGAGEIGGIYERQWVGMRSIVESGSVLLRRRRRTNRNMTLPYVVQVMEPDYLATHLDGVQVGSGRTRILSGKEYSARDELVACHLHTAHPGDTLLGTRGLGQTTRVLAADISHAFRMERAGQVQGASWFAPIMSDLRDLADTRDSYQLRQKIASCYSVFLYETEPGLGTSHAGKPTPDHVEPGLVMSIPPGKQVAFANPPGVTGMADFDRAQLMTIAVGLGSIPYEALTGDLRNVNFLSGRMGWLGFYRSIDAWRTAIVIPRICEREMQWFLEAAAVAAGIREPVRVHWVAPHRDLLDPKAEIAALREEVRLGTLAYPDLVRMRGRDPNQVIEQWAAWAEKIDERSLKFDWDPRQFSMAGNSINEHSEEISYVEDE